MSMQTEAPAVEHPTQPAGAAQAVTEPPKAEEPPKAFSQADVDRIVSDRLKRENIADLKAKAAEFDKAQEAAKSAEQRAAEQAQRAAEDARSATERADRAELAVDHGIGREWVDLLGGGSRDDMEARAKRLGPLLAAHREVEQLRAEVEALRVGNPSPASSRPVAALQPGATPVQVETVDDSYPAHWIPQRG